MKIKWYFPTLLAFCGISGASEILMKNFNDDQVLHSNGYSSGAIRVGRECCPFEFNPDFVEQTAQSFTLTTQTLFEGFDIALRRGFGTSFDIRFLLVGSSSINPGGTSDVLNHEAPDLSTIIESWSFNNFTNLDRILVNFNSTSSLILDANTRYWIVGVPGKEVESGDFVDVQWITGNIPVQPASVFARRNNYNGEDINDVQWNTGDGEPYPDQAGYSLAIHGSAVPEPSSIVLSAFGLILIGVFNLRRKGFSRWRP